MEKPCGSGVIIPTMYPDTDHIPGVNETYVLGVLFKKWCMFSSSNCAFLLNNKPFRCSTLGLLPGNRPLFLISRALQHFVAHHKLLSLSPAVIHMRATTYQSFPAEANTAKLLFSTVQVFVC